MRLLFGILMTACVCKVILAQAMTLGGPSAGASAAPALEMTAADAGAFLDGILPPDLARNDIAGAVVAVVKDGKLLLAKGYGYSDVARKIPVSPEGTLFRTGSVSKLFTWTAVMQLVEQGKLDLDRDVNEYLDFKIPPAFGKPITLANIMTHTSGFEETFEDMFVADAKDLKPLGPYLMAHLPRRLFPPGTTPAYSNYAAVLAGYIVERVSGEPFADYIETHIFKPLGMARSTFLQPLPADLAPLMSRGYLVASGPPKPFEILQWMPASSLSTTAMDMSRFMVAHLQDGQYGNVRILRPETARLMHARHFVNLPEMNAMALGFYENSRNGHRIIGHGGDIMFSHSECDLILDAGVGVFISINSAGKGWGGATVCADVVHAFLDRYFPYAPPASQQLPSSVADAQKVSGWYITSRRADSTFFKSMALLNEAKVSANRDGTISVNVLKNASGQPKSFREISPMLFREVDGQDMIGFKTDDSGRRVAVLDSPAAVFQKAPWYEAPGLNRYLLIASVAVLLIGVLLWPVGALIRRHYGRPLQLSAEARIVILVSRLVAIVDLAFLIAIGVTFIVVMASNLTLLGDRLEGWLRFLQILGWLGLIGSVAPLYGAVRSWMDRQRWLAAKIGDTLVAAACLCFVWFALSHNFRPRPVGLK